jgi:hypothetical protein
MFDPQFYVAQPVTIRVFSSIHSITKNIFPPAQSIYTDAPASYEFEFNENTQAPLDLFVTSERPKEYAFVGNVMDSKLILMSPNQFPLQDLSDLKQIQSAVIQVPDNGTANVIKNLISEYPDVTVTGIKIRIGAGVEQPIMYAFMMMNNGNASPEIAKLVRQEPMHVVTMSKINNGNYFVSDTEKPFFEKHKAYEKSSFDMHNEGVKFYPGLSIRGQLLYYPTIKYKYTLYARTDFSTDAVNRLLTHIIDKKIMPLAEVGYNPEESLPTHRGALEVYQKLNIYTKKPRQPIWQGF